GPGSPPPVCSRPLPFLPWPLLYHPVGKVGQPGSRRPCPLPSRRSSLRPGIVTAHGEGRSASPRCGPPLRLGSAGSPAQVRFSSVEQRPVPQARALELRELAEEGLDGQVLLLFGRGLVDDPPLVHHDQPIAQRDRLLHIV